MVLVSNDVVEFRRCVVRDGQNGKNYYYHFEDDQNGAFQLWSKKDFTSKLKKGDNVKITLVTRLWENNLNYNLDNIEVINGK